MFRIYVGDTVKVIYPRHELDEGKRLLVTGIQEDAETGTTVIELWG